MNTEYIEQMRNTIAMAMELVNTPNAFETQYGQTRIQATRGYYVFWASANPGEYCSGYYYRIEEGAFEYLRITDEFIRFHSSDPDREDIAIPFSTTRSEEAFFQFSLLHDIGELLYEDTILITKMANALVELYKKMNEE